jgi:hypothetical protein
VKRTFAYEAKLVFVVVAELGQEGFDTGWTRVEAHGVDADVDVAVSPTNSVRSLDPVAVAGALRWLPIHCGPLYRTGILTGLEGAPQGEGDHCAVSATAVGAAAAVVVVVAVGYYGDAVAVATAGVSVDSGSVDVAAVAVAVVVAVPETAG